MSEDLLTDDNILRFTQGQRKKLEAHLLANGWPTDEDAQGTLMTLWNDMDRQALGNKRIGAAEKLADSDKYVASVIADVVRKFGSNIPYENGATQVGQGLLIEQYVESEQGKLPRVEPVPGEMSIGTANMNFGDFVKAFEDE
ncbi:hypothetical protein D3C85_604020 [compost metagenome]